MKKSYSYGRYVMGWLPCDTMQSGGRYAFFRSIQEYEKVYFKATIPAHPSLDKMISAAGVRGGKCRYEKSRRGR